MNKKILVLSILVLFLLIGNASARDWYVNNEVSCNDSWPGTQSQPLCTLSAANTKHASGDTVYFTGTFRDEMTPKKD